MIRVAMIVVVAACAPSTQPEPFVVTLPSVPSASSSTATVAATGPFALTFRDDKKWNGAHANASSTIFGFWGQGRDVFAIGSSAIYRSSDRGAHWTESNAARGNAIWGSSLDDLWAGGKDVARSTDRGVTWTNVASMPDVVLGLGGRDASDVFAVGIGFIRHSTDHGQTFQPIVHGLTDVTFYSVVNAPPDLFFVGLRHEPQPTSSLGYHTVAVMLRYDRSGSFSTLVPPIPNMTDNEETRHMCFTSSGTMFVAMSYSVYASRDRGTTWRHAATVGTEVLGLACDGREVIAAGRNKRLMDSVDDGVTWSEHDLDAVLPGPELIALQAAYLDGGLALVGGEAYTGHDAGTLLRRASR